MSSIHSSCPARNSSIGIAFSGGLDTRTALLWLYKRGLQVHAYTADLAQPDEKDVAKLLSLAREHGACNARLLDCRQTLAKEGILAIQCGAFHIQSGGRKYFNTTPLGRAVSSLAIVRAMKEDNVSIFGDGSTHKGNDIQRFYRYGLLCNPALEVYKPWLDKDFVNELGGRQEMSAYLKKHNKPYHRSASKAYSTDANLLGATHEAKKLEFLDQSMRIVEAIMGLNYWQRDLNIESEKVKVAFQRGQVHSINDHKCEDEVEVFTLANEIGGRHGLGMSDQIENRVIEAKSRGIYEAPGMALLHICYERLLAATHNENMLELYYTEGRRLARLLYEGRWYDPEALLLKDALRTWLANPINGHVILELRRGDDYTILETHAPESSYEPEKLSMEKTETAFSSQDRIGALHVQNLGLRANRDLIQKYLKCKTDNPKMLMTLPPLLQENSLDT